MCTVSSFMESPGFGDLALMVGGSQNALSRNLVLTIQMGTVILRPNDDTIGFKGVFQIRGLFYFCS